MSADRYKRALEAYKSIMLEPRAPDENAFCPPPNSALRDKKWSKELRTMWLDCHSVRLQDDRFYSEKFAWCKENSQFFWVAGNQRMWYFSDKNAALLFKLTFGGDIANERL